VKALAERYAIPVEYTPRGCLDYGADLGIVVAYGKIIPTDVLSALDMINVHFSLLPRWRGAAPVERALLAGDDTTGVCLMKVEEGLDTGPLYRKAELAIQPSDTAAELTDRLAKLGAKLLVAALAEGLGNPEPQVGEPTYAAKLTSADLELDWSRPAVELERVVRVGRAWTTWRGERLLVLDATALPGQGRPGQLDGDIVFAGEGALRLVEVQPQSKRPMDAASWLRGTRPGPDEILGAAPRPGPRGAAETSGSSS
jgi:methionyl-tRNA formyltransferase